jgi:hypothetical protein
MTPIRSKNLERTYRIRQAEANDAFDYRWGGDYEGRHAARCLFAQRGEPACAQVYDPYPEGRDSAPADPTLYQGTGIGYLYGEEDTERFAWEFAGWTIRKDGSL